MRLFFALFPSQPAAETLHALGRASAGEVGGRASRAASIHLTLAFLGEVPGERYAELVAIAQTVCARAEPFAIAVDFIGHWRHNRLLWAGCSATPAGLSQLATALRGALAAGGFLVDREPGRFTPHLTLVRKVGDAKLPAPPARAMIEPVAWQCTAFDLVSSPLAAAPPGYQVLARFPLSGSAPEERI